MDGGLRISFKKSPSSFSSVSAVDVLKGNFDQSLFDNTLVLVGATAFGLDDIVPTPYSGSSPGVELQARVLTSILDGDVPFNPQGGSIFNGLVSALIGGLMLFICPSTWKINSIRSAVSCLFLEYFLLSDTRIFAH